MKPQSDHVVSLRQVSKKYRLFDSALQRLIERLDPLGRSRHRDFWALTDVSFDVGRGECVGLLGRNGSGKSTLLQIVAGVIRPTTGLVSVDGRVAALLALGSGLDPNLTGRENVRFQGRLNDLDEAAIEDSIEAIQAFADIGEFFDQPLRTYSSGMYARLAFAAAINVDPDLLIVDEALSVGDAKFQEKCFRRIESMKDCGTSILLVSHNVHTMIRTCDRCVLLEKGAARFIGLPSDAVNAYHGLLYGGSPGVAAEGSVQSAENEASPDRVAPSIVPPASGSAAGADWIEEWMLSDPTPVERFRTRLSYNPAHARLGDGRARILDYVVVCGTDVDAVKISSGATVEIIVRVHYLARIEKPIVGLALATRDGALVFGTNSRLLSAPVPTGQANSISVYRIAFHNRLAGGDFFLNIGVASNEPDEQTVFLDNLRSLAHLVSEPTPEITGVANLGGVIVALGFLNVADHPAEEATVESRETL